MLGGVGPAGGEGSRGAVGINATKVADDAPDPTKYHRTARGTVVPHRQSDMGRLPGLDADAGLAQFRVVDIDDDPEDGAGMSVSSVHQPGELDTLGKPKEKDPCPTTNPISETSESTPPKTASTSSPSPNQTSPQKTETRPSSIPPLSPAKKTQKQLLSELCERVNELSTRLLTEAQTSSSAEPLLSALLQKLNSLTNDMDVTATPKTQPENSRPQIPWEVEMRGEFGVFKSEAAAVDLRREGTVIMLFDPDKPHLVPARSEEPLDLMIKHGEFDFDLKACPNGWSSPLLVGDADYLLLIMDLAE